MVSTKRQPATKTNFDKAHAGLLTSGERKLTEKSILFYRNYTCILSRAAEALEAERERDTDKL